jgi:predicted pyridoxine 5'-phosphate oxidase superfamily flavin-nucleotide-binding protein
MGHEPRTTGGWISTVAELEARLGKTPGPMHQKVIDHLDEGAKRWIAASPLMFAGFGSNGSIAVTLGGGAPGFVEIVDSTRLRVAPALLDAPEIARANGSIGALFLIPGLGETLRVNGRVVAVSDAAIEVGIEECYVHCAKALIRSDFWPAAPQQQALSAIAEFLPAARFLVLATIDDNGRADVSPKGDPAGLMIRSSEDSAWFADRPGNRRADSFRNILTQPRVAIAALVPGMTHVVVLGGKARLSTSDDVRSTFTVREKRPLLATCVAHAEIRIYNSASLARARLWPATQSSGIDAATVMTQHVKLNRSRGAQAALVRTLLSVPGMMQMGLDRDYKSNLY